jgi:hypothetical protein
VSLFQRQLQKQRVAVFILHHQQWFALRHLQKFLFLLLLGHGVDSLWCRSKITPAPRS